MWLGSIIKPDKGFLFKGVHHGKGLYLQADLAGSPGRDDPVVMGHGAGTIRVHLQDLQVLVTGIFYFKDMNQGHVLPHLTEIVRGLGDFGPGFGLGGRDTGRPQEHQEPHEQGKPG
jgi:hypothetical protein